MRPLARLLCRLAAATGRGGHLYSGTPLACVHCGRPFLVRREAVLTPEELYLVEKARSLNAQGCPLVTTGHGVLMTYAEHARLVKAAGA